MNVKTISVLLACVVTLAVATEGAGTNQGSSAGQENGLYPWCGQYCMSFFTKTRSAKTVGKDHLSVSLKYQYNDWTQVRGADNDYHNRTSGQQKQRSTFVLCTKYGWAEDHTG